MLHWNDSASESESDVDTCQLDRRDITGRDEIRTAHFNTAPRGLRSLTSEDDSDRGCGRCKCGSLCGNRREDVVRPMMREKSNQLRHTCSGNRSHEVNRFESHPGYQLLDEEVELTSNSKPMNLSSCDHEESGAYGRLYVDKEFPACQQSISVPGCQELVWRRPKEIAREADFYVDSCCRFDLSEGDLDDHGLLSAISAMTLHPGLTKKVLPTDQKITRDRYQGKFRAQIWQYGKFKEVVVDDFIPCYKSGSRPAYCKSDLDDEFWPELLEKCFAKLCGSYEKLSGRQAGDFMVDLTGSTCIQIAVDRSDKFKQTLLKHWKADCLMSCFTPFKGGQAEFEGLEKSRHYAITGMKMVSCRGRQTMLIRIRDSRGGQKEWKGPWRDGGPEWKEIQTCDRDAMCEDLFDGEAWMPFDYFGSFFQTIEMCPLDLAKFQGLPSGYSYAMTSYDGHFEQGATGDPKASTFFKNKQYLIEVKDPDGGSRPCSVFVSLMQQIQKKKDWRMSEIGIFLYAVKKDSIKRARKFTAADKLEPTYTPKFKRVREVTECWKLEPGSYIIVPCSDREFQVGPYHFRVFMQRRGGSSKVYAMNSSSIEDEEVKDKFERLRDPWSELISVLKLQRLLNESSLRTMFKFKHFEPEVVKSLMATVNHHDHTMGIELNEFMEIWEDAKALKAIFNKYGERSTGDLSICELRSVIENFGYEVDQDTLTRITERYRNVGENNMSYANLLLCLCRLKKGFKVIRGCSKDRDGKLRIKCNDFFRLALHH